MKLRLLAAFLLLAFAVFNPILPAQAQAVPASSSTTKAAGASDSEIAAAKASHKVWVNLDTGVYHSRGRWYGKTKNGKFMTVDEAKKDGYKPAKRD